MRRDEHAPGVFNADEVPHLLGPEGPLAADLPVYEDRPFQRELALEVARLLEDGGRLAVEAPTGIGKSLGYGLPAAAWAVAGNFPVVVSTHTKALQEQLLSLEAPRLRRAVDGALRVEVLKGRSNYLCRRRFESISQDAGGEGTRELVGRLRPWVERTRTGDFAEIGGLEPRERRFLEVRAAGDARFCSTSRCLAQDGCFFKLARSRAAGAHLLIVNHALLVIHLFSDLELLPGFDALVVDEAHAFVRVALDHLSTTVGPSRIAAFLESAPGSKGRVPEAVRGGEGASWFASMHRTLAKVDSAARAYFGARNGPRPGDESRARYRDPEALRALCPLPPDPLDEALAHLGADVLALGRVVRIDEDDDENGERAFAAEIARFSEDAAVLREDLESLTHPDSSDREHVHWKEWAEGGTFSLHRSPLEAGPWIRRAIGRGPRSLVFTSATLAAGQDFTYFSREVGLEGGLPSVVYPSPFQFAEQATVLAVRRGPDPRDPAWASGAARTLDALLRDPGRKTLALFTSYRDLVRVREALEGVAGLGDDAYTVLAQEDGSQAARLLETFRAVPRAVLLGTASFWEGVDLPGVELEVLVLTRLPFGVPTDPRYEARAERVEAEGGNAFTDLYLPEAVLRFKQGFGRLIRRRADRGIVAVLDPRLLGKGYGKRFAAALPIPITEVSDGDALARAAALWWHRHPSEGGIRP